VAGEEPNVIVECEDLFPNGRQECAVISSRKVCPPNRSAKHNVTTKHDIFTEKIQDDMPWRVPRCMANLKCHSVEFDCGPHLEYMGRLGQWRNPMPKGRCLRLNGIV